MIPAHVEPPSSSAGPPPSVRPPPGALAPLVPRSLEFRREREAAWNELEGLLGLAERIGVTKLDAEQLRRLPALYRAALSSLSVARAISLDKNVVAYLESLSARAYVCVYGTRRGFAAAVSEFLRQGFPALVWSMRRNLWLSSAVMILGTMCGFALTRAEPDRFYAFIDAAMAGGRGPTSTREELAAVLHDSGGGAVDRLGAFASALFTHNAKIGLSCVALGFLAGVPVLLLLFVNGLVLGAMLAVHVQKGLGVEFLAWVAPHGVTELFAVALCGAAGLTIGQSLVFPGRLRRIDALAERGREAGAVGVGSVLLFFAAALIEGFFRQLVHDVLVRAIVAVGTAIALALYFGSAARRAARSGAGSR